MTRQQNFVNEKPIPLMVRLPPELHIWVKDTAENERRSLNAQIIQFLEKVKECEQQPTHRAPTP